MFVSSSQHYPVQSPSISYFLPEEWAFPHEGFAFSLHLLCCHFPKLELPQWFQFLHHISCFIEMAAADNITWNLRWVWNFPSLQKMMCFTLMGHVHESVQSCSSLMNSVVPTCHMLVQLQKGSGKFKADSFLRRINQNLCPWSILRPPTSEWGCWVQTSTCPFRQLWSVCDRQDPKVRLNPVQRKTPNYAKFQQLNLNTAGFTLLIISFHKQVFVV